MVHYEWCIETCTKDEYKDIIDNNFSDTLSFSKSDFACNDNEFTRLLLVRDTGNEIDGLQDRLWAYITDNELPEYFTDENSRPVNIKVPQRFHKKLQSFLTSK